MATPTDQQRLEAILIERIAEIENLTVDDVGDWLDYALEVTVYLRCREQETRFSHVEVLVSYGGPTVRVTWDGGTNVMLDVTTMSGRASAQVESTALTAVLEQYADHQV